MKILIDGPDQIIYQWDKGQRLMLHGADAGTRVDFARCDQNKAVSVYAYAEDGAVFCDIPDALLMEPAHLHGYVYEIDGDRGETVREFMLPVIRRPMPEDYVAPDEVLTWHELEQRIKKIEDEGVPDEKIAQAVEDYLEENPVQPGGSAGTVEIVDVVDRPPGSPPTVTETEDSTPAARKYILGIPGGSKGVGIKNTVVLDSPDGYTSVTISYTDGEEYTLTIPHGKDYILTPADKAEIAEMAAELVEVPEQDSSQNGDGLTGTEKTLILSLFRNAAYTADMSATFAQLEALWGGSGGEEPDVPDVPDEPDIPDVTLTSISATYNGGEVTAGTDVSALTDIVVVANYSDGTSKAVTDYTLSGEIAVGENTITVSYGGKTTSFVVTGVAESGGGDEPNEALIARDTAITTAGSTDHWTAGYINDSGAVGALTNNYFYDEYLEAQGFTFLNSAGSPIGGQLRIAEYDENKTFISRALVSNNATYAIGANSPTFIKCGFGSGINRSSIHTIVPLIQMADLCTVENVTIDTTGAEVAYNGRNATEYISIADGIESFYVTAVGVPAIVALYDSDYALVNRIAVVTGASKQYISVPDNAAYIRICVGGDAVYTSLKFTAE